MSYVIQGLAGSPLRLFSLASFAIALAWQPVLAQRVLAVDPPVELYQAQPGESIDGTVTVVNPGAVEVRARIALSDWRYRDDGSPEYPGAGTLERSLSAWTSFNPSMVMLAPGAKATIRYTIDVPDDVQPGSHWGVLFFTGEDPAPKPGARLATFNVRVGHVMYVNVAPERPAGEIVGIFGEPSDPSRDSYSLAIQYANTGNVAQKLTGYLELRDATGASVFRQDLPMRVSLPGETTMRVFKILGPLDAGAYSALVVYNYGNAAKDVAGEYGFILESPLPAPTAATSAGDASGSEGQSP